MLKLYIPCDSVARAVGADQVADALQREAERRQLPLDIQRTSSRGLYSREGANVDIHTADGRRVFEDGPYNDAPYILQAFAPLPRFADSYTLIGSWVVGDRAAGIGIREDDSLITKDSSRFLPHVVLG